MEGGEPRARSASLAAGVSRAFLVQRDSWAVEEAIQIPAKDVSGWILPKMPGEPPVLLRISSRHVEPCVQGVFWGCRLTHGSFFSALPAFPSDLVISLDDKYLYVCNWLHGDIRQYEISRTCKPRLVGQVRRGQEAALAAPWQWVAVVGCQATRLLALPAGVCGRQHPARRARDGVQR